MSTLPLTDEFRIPWPGPRPYEEKDWEDFFGRDDELRELLERVRVNKLTVLLGGSGTGKTSLIRAGVVPLLRQERYHPQGDQSAWPVLLLRRWGAVGSSALEQNLLAQLEWAISAIKDWGLRLRQVRALADAENLAVHLRAVMNRENGNLSIVETIEELARAEAQRCGEGKAVEMSPGGLILVFDQFEEQLRAGTDTRRHALELIGNLVRSRAPTRILLSMRKEFRFALRPLELGIGSLSGSTYYLGAMEDPTVIETVRECSTRAGLPIDHAVAERIVLWLERHSGGHSESGVALNTQAPDADETSRSNGTGTPDLLQLQAVLLELSRYAVGRQQSSITNGVLDDFTSQFHDRSESNEEVLGRRVLGGALERWIESALRGENSSAYGQWIDVDEVQLDLQIRRIAIRLAPRLSSGDYKVSQEEETLFRQTLGDEILRLGLKDPELRSRMRIVEHNQSPPSLNWEELGPHEVGLHERQMILSGLARIKNWSPTETGDKILLCFKEALHRLARANILQYTTFGAERRLYWELVHDQFGPSFSRWAERERGTWDDCKNSLVVSSGIHPIAVPVSEIRPPDGGDFYDVVKVSWQSCSIENSRSRPLTLRKVRFRECYLVGTIFESIDFVGCLFEKCELRGVLFRNCSFRADEHGRPTRFDQCDADISIVRGLIADLEFHDCQLLQPAVEGVELVGEIRYTGESKVIQGYFDTIERSTASGCISFDERSRAAWCLAGHNSWKLLRFENPNLNLHNSPLEEEYKVRR